MAYITEIQRIEALFMVGNGDIWRTQPKVRNLFNIKYPIKPIIESSVSNLTIFTTTKQLINNALATS